MITTERFEKWWHQEGSVMAPTWFENTRQHTKRVCEIAWANGHYIATIEKPKQGWQPIETAPKGGSILAYQKSTVFIATYAEYHDGNPCWRDEGMFIAEPTHWMPLPEPPSENETEQP